MRLACVVTVGLLGLSPTRGQEPARAVEPARIEATLEALTAFPTRSTFSPSNIEAGAWIEREFRRLGYTEVARREFRIRDLERFNVVATKRGTARAEEYILVGAHYDSRMERLGDARAPAPGADDNATGVAAILEIARVLRDVPTERSIRFVAFSGEEQGLVGSRAYASRAKQEGMKIEVVINLDMVGRPIDPKGREIMIEHDPGLSTRENDAGSRSWADRLIRAASQTSLVVKEGPIYGSDYIPFEQAGFACVGLFDGADREPFYHTSLDTLEGVNVDYCAEAARVVIGAVLSEGFAKP